MDRTLLRPLARALMMPIAIAHSVVLKTASARPRKYHAGPAWLFLLLIAMALPADAGPGRSISGRSLSGAGAGFLGSIGAGDQHTCALPGDGTVRCWGLNDDGQLGDGTTSQRLLPVTVEGLGNAVALAVGGFHNCALLTFGTVRCWGKNSSGQLGDGTLTRRVKSVAVAGLSDAVAIGAGKFHTCAVRANGAVVCWGDDEFGQVGDGALGNNLIPAAIGGVSAARSITAGVAHTCVLLADGGARCWGRNNLGQLGNGQTTSTTLKVTVHGLANNATAIDAGDFRTCAILATGRVACWGSGVATANLVSGLSDVVSITAGAFHNCASRANGRVACWGSDTNGQLGDGAASFDLAPDDRQVGSDVVAVGAGRIHTCAMANTGRVLCWGDNSSGQLGDGSTASSNVPIVSAFVRNTSAMSIATGSYHSCAVRSNGIGACWGANERGQLGTSSLDDTLLPTQVRNLNLLTVAAGLQHSCGLRPDGTVYCWGRGRLLGDATDALHPTPTPIGGITTAVDIVAGLLHTCALLVDGKVRCWGFTGLGLHPGMELEPVEIPGLGTAVELAAGQRHTCARLANGTVKCWGSGSVGQLGNGLFDDQLLPVSVSGLANVIALAAGGGHNCALRVDGLVRCWGLNDAGQLGEGVTSAPSSLPVPVSLISGASSVAAGANHTCVQLADGSARCWGRNREGQLGDGTTTDRLTPVIPSRLSSIVRNGQLIEFESKLAHIASLSTGASHTCALQATGAPYCWGRNDSGQVGDGTSTNPRLRPVEVPSFRFNIDPAASLRAPGRLATVTALLNCPEGQEAALSITLRQGASAAQTQRREACMAGLERYPISMAAQGKFAFRPGEAVVEAEVVVFDRGHPIDTQRWTRQVLISHGP